MKSWMTRGAVALTAAAAFAVTGTAHAQQTTTTTTGAQPASPSSTTVVAPQPAPAPQTTVVQPAPAAQTTTTAGVLDRRHEEGESAYAPNRYLLTSGLIVFGVPYLTSVIVASSSNHYGDSHLFVPLAGPWMDIADRGPNNLSNDNETTNKVLLGVDGVFQAIGAIEIVSALLMPETVEHATTVETAGTKVHFTPAKVGYEGYGLAAFATF